MVVVFFLVIWGYTRLTAAGRLETLSAEQRARIRTEETIAYEILNDVTSDLMALAENHAVPGFLADPDGPDRADLTADVMALAAAKLEYDQIRFLSVSGRELLRIDTAGRSPRPVPAENLQDKSSRYYFRKTIDNSPEEIYVSRFDLNVENGRIETPFKPTIRFGAVLKGEDGRRAGVLIFNYRGGQLLERLRQAALGAPGRLMAADSDGYWLLGPDPDDEWGFQAPERKGRTLGARFPAAWRRIKDEESGQFLDESGLVTFGSVIPSRIRTCRFLDPGQAPLTCRTSGDMEGRGWKIVHQVPPAELAAAVGGGLQSALPGVLLVALLAGPGVWYVASTIVSRRAAEEESHRLAAIVESADDAIIGKDLEGNILSWNRGAQAMYGYYAEEAAGRHISLIVPPERRGEIEDILKSIRSGGRVQPYETRRIRKDGTEIDVYLSFSPLRDARGAIVGASAISRDISARKTAERELVRNRQSLARAQQTAHLGSWEWDAEEQSLVWSDEVYRIFGLDPEAGGATYETYMAHIHPDDVGMLAETVAAALETGESYDVEHRVVRPDGEVRYVNGQGQAERDEEGRVVRLFGTVLDVTERKKMELRLRESERSLAKSQEIAGLGNWTWEMASGRVEYSEAMYRLLEVNPGDLGDTYDAFLNLVHPEDRDRVKSGLASCIFDEVSVDLEHRLIKPDGGVMYVHLLTETVYDSADEPVRLVGAVQDVTERRRAADRLRESEARIRAIVDTAAEAIITIDQTGVIESFNRAAENIFGYQAGEVAGRKVNILMPSDTAGRHDGFIARYLDTGDPHVIGHGREVQGRRKDGSLVELGLAVSELRLGGRVVFTGVLRDITRQKAAEEQLRRQAIYDGLTGLYNRRHFMSLLETELGAAKRHGLDFSVCICDLDHFKAVNDTYGHRAGDDVLAGFAALLTEELRAEDTAGRYGGEEFAVFFPMTSARDAVRVLERIRVRLEQQTFGEESFRVTASFGLAEWGGADVNDAMLIDQADQALYQAKKAGRNRVVVYRPDDAGGED